MEHIIKQSLETIKLGHCIAIHTPELTAQNTALLRKTEKITAERTAYIAQTKQLHPQQHSHSLKRTCCHCKMGSDLLEKILRDRWSHLDCQRHAEKKKIRETSIFYLDIYKTTG